jgi:hypothetical protein
MAGSWGQPGEQAQTVCAPLAAERGGTDVLGPQPGAPRTQKLPELSVLLHDFRNGVGWSVVPGPGRPRQDVPGLTRALDDLVRVPQDE